LFDEEVDPTIASSTDSSQQQPIDNAPLEAIWRAIWSKNEIHLIYNLFQLTEQTTTTSVDSTHNRQGYISSIEDILRAKEEVIDEKIHQANLWI
jgi:hypothetical protein